MKLYYNRKGLNGNLCVVIEFNGGEGDSGERELEIVKEGLDEHHSRCPSDSMPCKANILHDYLDTLIKGKDPE